MKGRHCGGAPEGAESLIRHPSPDVPVPADKERSMKIEDLVLISTDDHVVEPPSVSEYFRDHVPAKFRDRVPRVIRRPDGSDAWLIEISGFPMGAEWMVEEIRRLAAKGCHAVSFHPETYRAGFPDYHGDEWDPA